MVYEEFRKRYDQLPKGREATEYLLAFAEDAMQSCPEELSPLLEAARRSCLDQGLPVLSALCDRLLGWLDIDRSDYPAALVRFERALQLFQREGDEPGRLKALNGIASVHSSLGQFETALEIYRQALSLAETLGDTRQAMLLVANIGSTLNDLHQEAEAVPYLRRAVNSGLLSPLNESMILTEMAKALHAQGNEEEAGGILSRSVEIARRGPYVSTLSIALDLLGLVEMTKGRPPEEFRPIFAEARALALQAGDRAAETMALNHTGQASLLQGDALAAAGYFGEARELSRSIGARHLEAEACQGLAEANQRLRRWRKAYEAFETFHRISKQLHDANVTRQLDHLKADQARKETELLREQSRVLALLGEIGQKISASLDLESIVRSVDESIGGLMASDLFGLGLYDAQRRTIDFRLFREVGQPVAPFESSIDSESFSAWCILNRSDILINDMQREHHRYKKTLSYTLANPDAGNQFAQSGLYTPLQAEGKVLGVLSVQSYRPNAYTDRDLATLKTLAASISVAIQNARLFEKVNQLATVDALTGASTRRHLFESAELAFQAFLRNGLPLALIMIDLDHFKALNDNFGHAVGDRVLAEFGALVLAQKRPHDIFGRYGGEEFALVQQGTSLEGALKSAERLCAQVRQLRLAGGDKAITLTASFGVTVFEATDTDITLVFSRADEALYVAKQRGRNRVVVHGR